MIYNIITTPDAITFEVEGTPYFDTLPKHACGRLIFEPIDGQEVVTCYAISERVAGRAFQFVAENSVNPYDFCLKVRNFNGVEITDTAELAQKLKNFIAGG